MASAGANDLKERTRVFSHAGVKLALSLGSDSLSRHIQRQLIRSVTSVAANYRAASLSQSKNEFIAKLSIVVEESDECIYWIEFMREEKLLEESAIVPVLNEAKELTVIFVQARRSAQNNSRRLPITQTLNLKP